MAMAKQQRDAFDARLNRIKKGNAPNTMGEIHVGPREEVRAGQKSKTTNTVRMKRKKKNVNIGEGSNWVMVPAAFVIGGLSMFVGQAVAFHFFGGGLAPLDLQIAALEPAIPYANFAFAGLLALIFTWTFGFSNLKRKLAVLLGLAAVFYFEGDLVENFTGTYASMYSEDYVLTAPEPKLPGLIERAKAEMPGLLERAQELANSVTEAAQG